MKKEGSLLLLLQRSFMAALSLLLSSAKTDYILLSRPISLLFFSTSKVQFLIASSASASVAAGVNSL